MQSDISRQFTFKTMNSQINEVPSRMSQTFNDQYLAKKRTRRHKIFEDNTMISLQRFSTQQKKRSPIFDKSRGKITSILQHSQRVNQKIINNKLANNNQIPFNSSYKDLIEKKLAQKGNYIPNDNEKEKLMQRLAHKQRQIKVLKLQIERSKRCENLNKSNEEIYKRLIGKMKQNTTYSMIQDSKQSIHEDARTPIHSLTEIRFTPYKLFNSLQEEAKIAVSNRVNLSEPLKTIPQKQEVHLKTESKTENIRYQSASKDQGQSKCRFDLSKQSPNSKFHQTDPIYLKLQSQMNASRSRCRINMNDLPLSIRLKEMNRALQNNVSDYARRASRRYSSQRKQKQKSIQLQTNNYLSSMK